MEKIQAIGDSKFYFTVTCIKGKTIQTSQPEFRWKLNLLGMILRKVTTDTYKHSTESTTLNLPKITKKCTEIDQYFGYHKNYHFHIPDSVKYIQNLQNINIETYIHA